LVLFIIVWDTSLDRAHQTASNDVIFESGTSDGTNIFNE
jgi:hypothetical protein